MNTYQKPRFKRLRGFTLIELLVVIAIIGILIAILTPALRSALDRAKRARVQADAKSIESAIRAYYNEYSKLPVPDGDQGGNDREYKDTDSKKVIAMLTTNNARRIIFLEAPNGATDGTYQDVWGEQFGVALDCNYNGLIDISGSTGLGTNKVFSPGVAYSGGPDKDLKTETDNIYSFK
ncbi:MAG: type II secretion system GspH family protein [Kiritimatiellae bacterium]|nr:type II secretion system GspH family protein [Kiritimatiellia bacterium]